MEFYNINKVLDECNNFFKPVEEVYQTPIQIEAKRVKALKNTMGYLTGEIRC